MDFVEYSQKKDIVEEVLSGETTFGILGSSLILENLKNKPVVIVSNYFKRSPLAIITKPDIRLPTDLKGRKLMISNKDLKDPSLIQMFKMFDMSLDDIELTPHTFNIDDFIQGDIDATTVFLTDQLFKLQKSNVPFRILDPSNYGLEMYQINLFTSEHLVESNPELVKQFKEASDRGWHYALEHPEEIIDVIQSKYNTQNKTRKELLFEAEQTSHMMLSKVFPIGDISRTKIEKMANLFYQLGDSSTNRVSKNFIFSERLNKPIILTDEEKEFLTQHPVIRVANDKNYVLFDFYEKGQPAGYSMDLITKALTDLGVQVEIISNDVWSELVSQLKKGDIDILTSVSRTKSGAEYLNYTEPYLKLRKTLLVNADNQEINTINDLQGKVLALPASYAYNIKWLKD